MLTRALAIADYEGGRALPDEREQATLELEQAKLALVRDIGHRTWRWRQLVLAQQLPGRKEALTEHFAPSVVDRANARPTVQVVHREYRIAIDIGIVE